VSTVLLRLIGPLQSWGIQSRFGDRDTQLEPTKSGVIGIIAAALGMSRDDDAMLARLRMCTMAVRVDHEGQRMRDYHVTGGGTFRNQPYGVWESDGFHGKTVLSDRYYVIDAAYHVALTYEEASLASEICAALQQPVFPLFLGRRSCPPSVPIGCGEILTGSAIEVLDNWPLDTSLAKNISTTVRMVVECAANEGRMCADVPLSFTSQGRRFGVRYVKNIWRDRALFPKSEVSA